ncbi:hypothetical protein [Streptomyces canus]|uniref:hypothetical protein n=1 Tax=Streptomyces canus TaxID=58343 RepID=UPI00039D74C7|nr:hypothetical protein [Streptomyces canus]
MQQSREMSSVPRPLAAGDSESLVQWNSDGYDRRVTAELGRAPGPESTHLFKEAAQRRNLSGDELAAAGAAREEIKRRAHRISELLGHVESLPLTADERSLLRPPYGRANHLPSPNRPYAHLAVHTGQGAVSVTPVWATTTGGNVVMSTVENRIKARATALDPMVALSVSAGIGNEMSFEVGGFARQSPDADRELIRTLAGMYSKPKIGEHVDGNYTSWDQRERNERIRLEILAYRVRNELGDHPVHRSAPYVQELAPRYSDADLSQPPGRKSHDRFWTTDEDSPEGESDPREARDELAILGMTRRAKESEYRSVHPTYGHFACFDEHGLLRCRNIGFDLMDVEGEARISFLVRKRDSLVLRRNPAGALSVAKYSSGSVWLQSQGRIHFHEDPDMLRAAIRRLESRYNRVHQRLALDLGMSQRPSEDYMLATLSRQTVSSRYRETERSLRSAGVHRR